MYLSVILFRSSSFIQQINFIKYLAGLLKKSGCSVAESSVGSTVSNSELPLPGSASALLDCSTSKRIKFRSACTLCRDSWPNYVEIETALFTH